ncbi:MAG: hypothetical protein KAQ68_08395 [Clostridiales bacterium]|nr:hypothetical protein [Clostridiales bacterium]
MCKDNFFNKIKKGRFLKYLLLFLCLIILYTVLLSAASAYPAFIEKYVKYHIEDSAEQLSEIENDWVLFFTQNISSRTDNYADSLMLHITYCTDILPPVKAAFAGAIYGDTYADSQLAQLVSTTEGTPSDELVYYSRYWHGYRIWLKPLLIFFDYLQIRLFNMYIFYILFMLCCIYLYKKVSLKLSLAFAISIVMLNIVLVPMNLMFSCVFIISFIGCILAIKTHESIPKSIGLLFFALGSATMFFDFYSYPFLTLGFPLVCLLSIKLKDESSLKNMFKFSLICILTWVLGYLLTWLANFGLSTLVLGGTDATTTWNILKYRLQKGNASLGIFNAIWQFIVQGYKAIQISLSELLIEPHGSVLTAIASISVILFVFFREKSIRYKKILGFLPIFIVPMLWYAIASKPAIQHVYFQYRGMGLWVMIILTLLFFAVDYRKIYTVIKKLFQKNQP